VNDCRNGTSPCGRFCQPYGRVKIIDGPKKDVHGDVRVKMKHSVTARRIQVVLALNAGKCTVITVI